MTDLQKIQYHTIMMEKAISDAKYWEDRMEPEPRSFIGRFFNKYYKYLSDSFYDTADQHEQLTVHIAKHYQSGGDDE